MATVDQMHAQARHEHIEVDGHPFADWQAFTEDRHELLDPVLEIERPDGSRCM